MAKSPPSSRTRGKHVPRKIDPTPRVTNPKIVNIAAGAETALVKVCEDLGIAL